MTEIKRAELPPVEFPHRERDHDWNRNPSKDIAADQSIDGNTRIHKICPLCGMTKITVQPKHGQPWNEYRTAKGERVRGQRQPACIGGAQQ